ALHPEGERLSLSAAPRTVKITARRVDSWVWAETTSLRNAGVCGQPGEAPWSLVKPIRSFEAIQRTQGRPPAQPELRSGPRPGRAAAACHCGPRRRASPGAKKGEEETNEDDGCEHQRRREEIRPGQDADGGVQRREREDECAQSPRLGPRVRGNLPCEDRKRQQIARDAEAKSVVEVPISCVAAHGLKVDGLHCLNHSRCGGPVRRRPRSPKRVAYSEQKRHDRCGAKPERRCLHRH